MRLHLLWIGVLIGWVSFAGCSDDPGVSAGRDAATDMSPATSPDGGTDDDAGTATASAIIAPWGFDLTGIDEAAKPGDSFFDYADGKWVATHEIPSDRTRWGPFDELAAQAESQVHDLLDGLPSDAPAGSNAQKARDYYKSFLDVDAIEAAGLAPAQPGLDAIGAAKTHEDLVRLMARADLGLLAPIGIQVTIDEKNPDRYIVGIGQSGLGLPDRDYYLNAADTYSQLRTKYQAHIARLLGLVGESETEKQAQAILTVETQIADRHWPVEKRRDVDLTYNLRTRDQLSEGAGDFPWEAALKEAGLDDQKEFVVAELDAVQALASFFSSVSVDVWISYLKYHYIAANATRLPAAIDAERFDFYGRTLSGQPQLRERWKRSVAEVNAALGEVVGELYVKEHFPASFKAQMLTLVENLRATYGARFKELPWMSDATKEAAAKKLQTFLPKIGFPDKWKDYSDLEVRAGDAFGNAMRTGAWVWRFDVDRLGKPTDRGEWFMTPQTVNAYYNSTFNEVVFPAAILQPPFFDPAADLAVNYGGIGAVIGHEMGHGFDDQGAKSDERGVLRTWWQPEDEEAFGKLVDKLVAQYDSYEPLPGLMINGRLTVGENIGDLGGASVAYEAYHRALAGKKAPVLDGKTGDQRFFLAWAQVWRQLQRDEALRNQVMSDPHSPAKYRVDGVVRNVDAWYDAFEVKPGDALYLAPEDRVHIW